MFGFGWMLDYFGWIPDFFNVNYVFFGCLIELNLLLILIELNLIEFTLIEFVFN
ncbi:hypothetical protein GLOIN_2v1884397 [Rhizophagus irregularis DAOM 181602=DAOM 197198]|uniref:Uncharacterized protein n=1 Tax=Rhizophagus irregularis (strain DAOM 181602 / DAOM 197198 / MUCL 43194) TaxID=747089 RepID=A0A2P4P4K8_RHIID|nr:hypothetical protein GLOIN_2v1884397 [Rhizophagus irregularis DAOM 181602=DAOM 197198]POG60320.1 hypothetical protein GLOIN_2v1884397 [Rhizophagus irregularis DAOM 181602=DAOM 197198]|eukprot:XP_025167186.1 hypothetical protein GLOIN_2v1884397 [Rhizophagus irregularis DAOM 181602=DAOM 197198]